jgi:hypothetical protein
MKRMSMKELTDQQREILRERRVQLKSRLRQLAVWDMVLSGGVATALVIWLAVYVREALLQGAVGSVWFWVGMTAGIVLLGILVHKIVSSSKVARK